MASTGYHGWKVRPGSGTPAAIAWRAASGATTRSMIRRYKVPKTRTSHTSSQARSPVTTPNVDVQIWLGGRWFTVIGILRPVPLAPELDLGALIGWPAAQRYLGVDANITTVYTRTNPDAVEPVRELLARTANPAQPNEVDVSRPSDALAAQAAANTTFTGLLLGLGTVALLVGGIGIANTMVISVLERRAE